VTAKKLPKEYPIKNPTVPQVVPDSELTSAQIKQREANVLEFHRLQGVEGKVRHEHREAHEKRQAEEKAKDPQAPKPKGSIRRTLARVWEKVVGK